MLVAELLGLVEQRLAEQVPLHLDRVSDEGFVFVRVILITKFVLLLDLLDDAPFALFGPLLACFEFLASAYRTYRSFLAGAAGRGASRLLAADLEDLLARTHTLRAY